MNDTVEDQPAVVEPEDDVEPRDADATEDDGGEEGGKHDEEDED